ncbi:MAG TPA: CehA/McbA family metallohydrolase, partial [Anaerolineae bacterium]|nr:CehA/McbA family metallohydrolase [Anaerolineae bacterium]
SLPQGPQAFWGVPFDLGSDPAPRWLLLDGAQESVSIDLPAPCTYIVFAHLCDVSHDPEGLAQPADYVPGEVTRPGEHLADYILTYGDGSEHRQAVRRRFEVGEAVQVWGQQAFASLRHLEDEPRDWRGPYPATLWGKYQQGVNRSPTPGMLLYWIYALENPHPDRNLSTLRLAPTGAGRLAVAGITLYHGQEHPLRRRRLESMRVTLPEPALLEDVQTSVDLGIIARRYAVPAFDPEEWLADRPQGWGEEPPPEGPASQLLLDVTASPDATLRVAGSEIELAYAYEQGEAASTDGRTRVEILTPHKTWLHVSVIDNSTGESTPVRIHFRAPDGRYMPPYGHRHEVNDNWFEDYGGDLRLGSTQYAYVDGRFQIELPVGEVYVEIAKGFEYEPLRQRLVIDPGQRELTLNIDRAFDWRSRGWVTADSHVHFLSPQTAWLEAQAEGVNLVNLLASQWGDLYTNVADLTGDLSGVSRDDTLVWVGTENRQHLMGHMSLLGVKGDPVFPLCTGGPNESYLGDPTVMSLAEWSDLCREREGLVVIPHFPNPYCEVAADIVLGKVDAAEIRYFTPAMDSFNVREWYRFLNCGYRVAAVGGTDKMSAGMPVGGVRTYADMGDCEFTFGNWAAAVRAGRTFTTSGPLITLKVEGQAPGHEIRMPAGGGTLEAEAVVHSVQPFHELQIVVNGQVVERKVVEEGTREARLHGKIRLGGSGWIAARCISRLQVWHCWPIHIAAHTSPVYVRCGDQELFSPSDATYMLTLIDGGLTWLDTLSIPADPERSAQIRGVFESARSTLGRRLAHHDHHGG